MSSHSSAIASISHRTFGQCFHCNAGAGGLIQKVLSINGIELGKVVHARKEARRLDCAVQAASSRLQNRLEVIQDLLALKLDALSDKSASFGAERNLSRGEHEIAVPDRL